MKELLLVWIYALEVHNVDIEHRCVEVEIEIDVEIDVEIEVEVEIEVDVEVDVEVGKEWVERRMVETLSPTMVPIYQI
jgi:hypothetical protein